MSDTIELELLGGPQDGRTIHVTPPLRLVLIAIEPVPGRPNWKPEWEPLVYYDPEFELFRGVTPMVEPFIVEAANQYHRWAQKMDDLRGPIYKDRGDMQHYDFIGYHTPRELREKGEWDGFDPRVPCES